MGQHAVAKSDKANASEGRESQIDSVLAEFKRDQDELIPALQAVQRKLGYLPPETFERAGLHFRLPDSRVYGVATFYPQFDLERPCTHSIKVCGCTACYVHGSARIISAIRKKFGIKPGERTPDGKLMLERMSRCASPALAPVVVIDGKVHGRTSPEKIVKLVEGLRCGECNGVESLIG